MFSWQAFWESFPALMPGLWVTIELTLIVMPCAVAIALVLALVRVYGPTSLANVAMAWVEVWRATPLLLQLYWLYYVLPAEFGLQLPGFATVAVGLAAAIRVRDGKAPVEPDPMAGHAVDFLRMLTAEAPSDEDADALETYLLCSMDHGLNASTFTARVAASTDADPYACFAAALATLSGRRHGSAAEAIARYADELGSPDRAVRAARALRAFILP